jgi:serine phosphatase RsbU (regulator of sigma subunit)
VAAQVAVVQAEGQQRAALAQTLAAHGYQVVPHTPEAVLANGLAAGFDCILIHHCPINQQCIELIEHIRRQPELETVPLLVLAHDVTRQELTGTLTAGANAFLLEPYAAEELVAYLTAQLRLRQAVKAQLEKAQQDQLLLSRLAADLALGQQVQISLLPPCRLRTPSFTLEARVIPGGDLSGDYFDYRLVSQDRLTVLLADVSGHGIASALLASRLKALFELNQQSSHNPRQFLEQLNREIINLGEHYHIATAVSVVVDARDNVVKYASAGHRTMYWMEHDSPTKLALPATGPALGMFEEFEINEVTRGFMPGRNRLLAFTDGLVEFRRADGSWVVEQDFIDSVLLPNTGASIDQFITALVQASSVLSGQDSWEDDVSLFALDF